MWALYGAQTVAMLSAWPAAAPATAEKPQDCRWTYRFNLFDRARALDKQVFGIASNQSGTFGSLNYVGNAKVVDPGGNVLATTLLGSGMAVADVDITAAFEQMRGGMFHLSDRRPDVYSRVTDLEESRRSEKSRVGKERVSTVSSRGMAAS